MDIGAYVHLYGREFVHTDVRLALEYYLAAARVQGDTPAVRGKLLRELLTESRAYGASSSVASGTPRAFPSPAGNTLAVTQMTNMVNCRIPVHCRPPVMHVQGQQWQNSSHQGTDYDLPHLCFAGFLLGSGGTDSDAGALAAYVPDRDARRALISAIADECAAAAQVGAPVNGSAPHVLR